MCFPFFLRRSKTCNLKRANQLASGQRLLLLQPRAQYTPPEQMITKQITLYFKIVKIREIQSLEKPRHLRKSRRVDHPDPFWDSWPEVVSDSWPEVVSPDPGHCRPPISLDCLCQLLALGHGRQPSFSLLCAMLAWGKNYMRMSHTEQAGSGMHSSSSWYINIYIYIYRWHASFAGAGASPPLQGGLLCRRRYINMLMYVFIMYYVIK